MALHLPDFILLVAVVTAGCQAGSRTTFSGNRLPDIVPGQPGIDYPVASRVPSTRFRCEQQEYPGFFADPETGCQVFHVCRGNQQTSLLCPNGTLYHQRFFVCDWWFNVDCSKSVGYYALNKNAIQRQPQEIDRRLEIQPQSVGHTQEPTPTPSFAKFDRRLVSEPTFQEWASRHIPFSNPSDAIRFKSIRSPETLRSKDIPTPFSDPPFRTLPFTTNPFKWPTEIKSQSLSTTTTTTTTTTPRPKSNDNRGKDEYPVTTFSSNIPADNWLLLAKDPDFLNNVALSAQLYINDKTKGAAYLRTKTVNQGSFDQEPDFHPFQGFKKGKKPLQDPIAIERAKPSFKPSPLLSLTKETHEDIWTPASHLLSTSRPTPSPIYPSPTPSYPSPAPSYSPPSASYSTSTRPPVQPPRPPPQPVRVPQQTQQPLQQSQPQQHAGYPIKTTYKTPFYKQTYPFKPSSMSLASPKPWTKQPPKKQYYQSSHASSSTAYQVILTSPSDYQVILTGAPQPTAPSLPAASIASSSAPLAIRTPVLLPIPKPLPSQPLPLEPHPITGLSIKNTIQSQATVILPTIANGPVQRPTPTFQQPKLADRAAPNSISAQQRNTGDKQLFRSSDVERITSQSVPMKPSLLLSTSIVTPTRSSFEFEPTSSQKWTDRSSLPYFSTSPFRQSESETFVRSRFIPTEQGTTAGIGIVEDKNVASFVVQPASRPSLVSSL